MIFTEKPSCKNCKTKAGIYLGTIYINILPGLVLANRHQLNLQLNYIILGNKRLSHELIMYRPINRGIPELTANLLRKI